MSENITVKITIADYKKIAAQARRNKIVVADKEVEDTVSWLCKSRAKMSQVERPAQKGDFVEIEYSYDGPPRSIKDGFVLGEGKFAPGFEDNVKGLSAGQKKEFVLKNKPQNKNLKKSARAEKVKFWVKVISVQKMEIPQVDDEFVRGLGNFKSVVELKESIKAGIAKEKEIAESGRMQGEILQKICADCKFQIPENLIEAERDRMLRILKQEVAQKLKVGFDDYLKQMKRTEEEVKKDLLPQAEARLKSALVLGEIAKKEDVKVSAQEIEERINKTLKNYPDAASAKKDLDLEKLKIYAKEMIRNEKVLARLESFIKC